MEQYRIYRDILCIDLKSFYASVECAIRGLNPFTTPLVVADNSRSNGSVVLAVTPYLKRRGVPSRCRLYELPNDKDIIYAKPRMNVYLEYSTKIIGIYLQYVSLEDMHIYSVDEVFLDITSYLSYYKKTKEELALMILQDVYDQTNIPATCGIGPNMLISKLALDLESKHSPNFIASWDYQDIPNKLWPVKPLSDMWGIGHNMERNLNRMGIYSVGDLANFSRKKLKKFYGIMGEELYFHAHGIDQSIISEKLVYKPVEKSVGMGQMLYKDYQGDEILQIFLEMTDEVTKRLRIKNRKAYTVHLSIMYSKTHYGGFSRQITLPFPTVSEAEIYNACLSLFDQFYDGSPIRKVSIRLSQLVEEMHIQLNLFEDVNQKITEQKLSRSLDHIRLKYGKTSVFRGSSLTEESTFLSRSKMIGGHNG
jgi:DNA polymerase V